MIGIAGGFDNRFRAANSIAHSRARAPGQGRDYHAKEDQS